jgi:hypothetical protein
MTSATYQPSDREIADARLLHWIHRESLYHERTPQPIIDQPIGAPIPPELRTQAATCAIVAWAWERRNHVRGGEQHGGSELLAQMAGAGSWNEHDLRILLVRLSTIVAERVEITPRSDGSLHAQLHPGHASFPCGTPIVQAIDATGRLTPPLSWFKPHEEAHRRKRARLSLPDSLAGATLVDQETPATDTAHEGMVLAAAIGHEPHRLRLTICLLYTSPSPRDH